MTIGTQNFPQRSVEHAVSPLNFVEVLGARTHNLKNINVTFPQNQLTVLTGVSGSGKSSLAFDTINAEGQRRYRESFSIYTRSFLSHLPRPDVDKINGLMPVISLEQKKGHKNPRSTVGTATEIYDFMRLLYAKLAHPYALETGRKMESQTEEQILSHILKGFSHQTLTFMAPIVRGRKGHYADLLEEFMLKGFTKIRLNGVIIDLGADLVLERYKKHTIELVIDHIWIDQQEMERINQALTLAILYGKGTLMVMDADQKTYCFSTNFVDSTTGLSYDRPEPSLFSFNTVAGACSTCSGLGEIVQIDFKALIPNTQLSIAQGAIVPLGPYKATLLFKKLEALLKLYHYDLACPVSSLPCALLNLLLFGNVVNYPFGDVAYAPEPFEGIIETLQNKQERLSIKEGTVIEEMFSMVTCPSCLGARLNQVARSFKIAQKSISELSHMDLTALQQWFDLLPAYLDHAQQIIARDILKEINKRLQFLIDVGLNYLNLNRSLHSLSGGEAQRILLARQIGTKLLGILYVLDEPSIGLHQRDNAQLIAALKKLRDMGNTILVVEHDREMMLAADYLIEIGPQAGVGGGQVVASGTVLEFLAQNNSTADFLSYRKDFPIPICRRKGNGKWLTIQGCQGNNLKNIDLSIPLGMMVCITGVSGSGKSSLIHRTLVPILKKYLYNSYVAPLTYKQAVGLEHINKIIEVSQAPIGRTCRSNASTYTGMFADIRNFFALLPEAKIRGYKPSRFSFNLKEGRCSACEGMGVQRIDMGFLPELYVACQTCMGKRYNKETLQIHYKGKSIADVLDMTVDSALHFFREHPAIRVKLEALEQVGLGYITLGQHATTLSGGEAQRIKLATELALKSTGSTLYVLDEPSTGLHFQDILVVMGVLEKLVAQGNTVLIIEHNMDIIKASDYIIDLGPEGGQAGGAIMAQGTPEQVAQMQGSSTGCFLKKELARSISHQRQ